MPALNTGSDYTTGQTATAAVFNDRFDAIEAWANTTKLDATNLQDGAITTPKLADGSVTPAKLSTPGAVFPSSVSTSLPGSPTDGQVIVYQVDATNGIYWTLRYRSASASAYKWEFLGGSSLFAIDSGSEGPTNIVGTGYLDFNSPPSLTIPLAGDYDIEHGGMAFTTAANEFYQTISLAGTAQPDPFEAKFGPNAGVWHTLHQQGRKTGISASTSLSIKNASGISANNYSKNRFVRAVPVRVG